MNNPPTKLISPRTVPAELAARYSTSGPRYTSYPTAPQFKAGIEHAVLEQQWRASNAGNAGLSLYVHIPFCRKRCLYCGCHTTVCHDPVRAERYVQALLKEADRIATIIDPVRSVQQLALGGGTPTFLKPDVMAGLINRLKQVFSFADDGERSIEIDPESVDAHYLDVLLELGFNRFSFGVQDLNPEVQRAIGRVQSEAGLVEKLAHLQQRGCSAINLDLIYGLPLQTPESFGATVMKVVGLRPSRVAVFGYAHVPWVSPHQQPLEKYHLPSASERLELFGLAYEMFLAAGYRHVGMDHFALPEDELIQALSERSLTRNFMGYTTKRGLDLVGLGASSISAVNHTFAQNEKDVDAYMERAGTPLWVKGLVLTPEDCLRGEVILELMCNFFLDLAMVEHKYGIDFGRHFAPELAQLAAMEADGLVRVQPGQIEVTQLGRFFIRNICMPFDEYLKLDQPAAKYSKTI